MAENTFQQDAFQYNAFQHYIISAAVCRDRNRAEPIFLIEINLKNSGPTLYLSDRNILIGSQQYENYISEISGIEGEINLIDSSSSNTDISLTFKNDRYGSYNYLIEIGDTYPFEGAGCLIREVYLDDDNNPSDMVTIFKGVIDEPQDIDLLSFRCKLSSTMFQKDKQWNVAMIDTATYPYAYEDVGKLEPFVYGLDVLMPAVRVNWGAKTTLKADIFLGQTTSIELSDSSRFPSSGTILIDSEELSYTSISSHVLAGVTRGVNSTIATAHSAGAEMWEKQAQYDSLIASHDIYSVGDIYAEIQGTMYRVTSGVSGLLSGGKYYIRATSQIGIDNVKDDITVDQGNHSHSVGTATSTFFGDSGSHGGFNISSWTGVDANMYDQNLGTGLFALGGAGSAHATFNVGFPAYGGAPPTAVYKCITYKAYGTYSGYMTCNFGGTEIGEATTIQTKKFYVGTTPPTSLSFTASYNKSDGGLLAYVYEIWYEVQSGTATSADPAAGVIKIGSVISTNLVNRFHANVNGYKDPDGNYGGAGNVIERPDYVIKHFIVQKLGFSLTEIDDASFTAAGTLYDTYSYAFAFCVYDTIVPSEFINRLAFECRSTLRYIAGKWYLDVIPDTAPAAVKTISKSELAGKFTKFKFSKTSIVNLQNNLTAMFKRDYTNLLANNSDWLLTSKTSDTTSEGKYGTHPKDFEFECIRDQTTADSVLAHILLQRKNPLLTVSFPVFWEHFDLNEGDTFDISNPLFDARKFYIEKFSRIDKFRAQFEAKEWYN